MEDLPQAWILWGEPEVTRFIGGPFSRVDVEARLVRELETAASRGIQYWPIFTRADGEFVGCCGLRPYQSDAAVYELGVHLRRIAWGRGYAAEAARAAIEFAFNNLKAERLFAGHHPENDASRQLLAKLGFRYERDELYAPTGLRHPSYFLAREQVGREG